MASREECSEDTIYVAVGKDVKEWKSTLLWAIHTSEGKRICILHVHQPAQLIPFMGGRAPASSLKENKVREHRENERQKMNDILDRYGLRICRQMGVQAHKLQTETDSIEKGIVELIYHHGIRKLVMGAAAEKHYRRNMTEIRSNKAKYVHEQAPVFCHIQFICKGYLIFNREALKETETVQSNQLRSQSVNLGRRDSTRTGQSNYLPKRSFTVGHNRDSSGRSILDIHLPKGIEEFPSLMSRLDIVEGSSDELDDLSRSPSRRGVNVTLASSNDRNENGLELKDLSPAFGYSRSSSTVEVASPSVQRSPTLISSASSISKCFSNNGVIYDGISDNSLYEQLQQAMEEAEKEALRRRKAEKDRIEAIRRAQEELMQRKEIEEALAEEKAELEKVKNQRDQLREELRISREREASLNRQIGESQNERDQLQMERDNALKEAEGLRRKQGEASSRRMPQFSEFSRCEIEEATQSFHESQKIGQGGYGRVYKGLLRHTEVAIKRLESNGAQGTSQFQMEVRVLSQLTHPNLVKLFGYCPEVFALIYEYLPNGDLEDRLKRKDNSPPLSWQTRIRIATELCSVVVYLHNSSIVHGDLKPSNILLDINFVSKLSDFGICRLLRHDKNSSNNTTLYHITDAKGTLSYIDPEFHDTGELTMKADVYSFGIILLQLLTGKPPFLIANEVKSALDAGNLKALLDPSAGDWPIVLAQKLARLGLRCCDRNRKSRPDLRSDVWSVLEAMRASCGASSSSQMGSEDQCYQQSLYSLL